VNTSISGIPREILRYPPSKETRNRPINLFRNVIDEPVIGNTWSTAAGDEDSDCSTPVSPPDRLENGTSDPCVVDCDGRELSVLSIYLLTEVDDLFDLVRVR